MAKPYGSNPELNTQILIYFVILSDVTNTPGDHSKPKSTGRHSTIEEID